MDFFFLGYQKAGTSWIYSCLQEHPEICIPTKDTHFFSRLKGDNINIHDYEDSYSSCRKKQIKGEISTSYIYSLSAMKKIKSRYPSAKIFISVRNPVERAYSHYLNDVKAGRVRYCMSEFFDLFMDTNSGYAQNSMLKRNIEPAIEVFGLHNIEWILYDEIVLDPAKVISNIFFRLGVDDSFVSGFIERRVNVARVPRSFGFERTVTAAGLILKWLGLNQVVYQLKRYGVNDFLRRCNTETETFAPLNSIPKISEIRLFFADDINWFESLLDKKLDWKTS